MALDKSLHLSGSWFPTESRLVGLECLNLGTIDIRGHNFFVDLSCALQDASSILVTGYQ